MKIYIVIITTEDNGAVLGVGSLFGQNRCYQCWYTGRRRQVSSQLKAFDQCGFNVKIHGCPIQSGRLHLQCFLSAPLQVFSGRQLEATYGWHSMRGSLLPADP